MTEEVTQYQVNFPETTLRVLKELSARRGYDDGVTLRDALALLLWAEDSRDEGKEILTHKNGIYQELTRW
jgi:hypothetical protein